MPVAAALLAVGRDRSVFAEERRVLSESLALVEDADAAHAAAHESAFLSRRACAGGRVHELRGSGIVFGRTKPWPPGAWRHTAQWSGRRRIRRSRSARWDISGAERRRATNGAERGMPCGFGFVWKTSRRVQTAGILRLFPVLLRTRTAMRCRMRRPSFRFHAARMAALLARGRTSATTAVWICLFGGCARAS